MRSREISGCRRNLVWLAVNNGPVSCQLISFTALELAREYHMLDWVRALLDPVDIAQSPATAKKQISPPPKFEMPPLDSAVFAAPPTTRNKGRRSASPSKIASPAKKH